jgi:tetratricopeptide (TPR) repeat protein
MIAQLYAYLAGAYQHYGLYADSNEWANRAVQFGTRHNIYFAEATGYEFLGENTVHTGAFELGLEYAEKEFALAAKLQSRERKAWTHFFAAHCHMELDHLMEAEKNFEDGLHLAESIGENRLKWLHRPNLAVLLTKLGRFDEALTLVTENLKEVPTSLIYSRFEALRCYATVRYRRALSGAFGSNELEEAERVCREASAFLEPTESKVSQLWLGPLFVDVLVAAATFGQTAGNSELAEEKLTAAKKHLEFYQGVVKECQSPRFTREAQRLRVLIDSF